MNGNVQDELGLITEFQVAVLKALKPVILEMDPTTIHGWISNAQALRQRLSEALCPPEKKGGIATISVPTELHHLLELPLTKVFAFEHCHAVGYSRQALLSRVRNSITAEIEGNTLGPRGFDEAKLSDLIEMSRHDPYYFWKLPGLGEMGRDLIVKVLASHGLQLS